MDTSKNVHELSGKFTARFRNCLWTFGGYFDPFVSVPQSKFNSLILSRQTTIWSTEKQVWIKGPKLFTESNGIDTDIFLYNSMADRFSYASVINSTTIIFIGDNGTPSQVVQQYNSNRAKGSLYKGGINVPMIISGNQVNRFGQDENALINTTDLFTTITELCGINNEAVHDSKSFISLLASSFNGNSRDYIYS